MNVLLLALLLCYVAASGFFACVGLMENPWMSVYWFFFWPWEMFKDCVLSRLPWRITRR